MITCFGYWKNFEIGVYPRIMGGTKLTILIKEDLGPKILVRSSKFTKLRFTAVKNFIYKCFEKKSMELGIFQRKIK